MGVKEQELRAIVEAALEWCRKYDHGLLSIYATDKKRADAWTSSREPDYTHVSIGYRPEKEP